MEWGEERKYFILVSTVEISGLFLKKKKKKNNIHRGVVKNLNTFLSHLKILKSKSQVKERCTYYS